jgi:hypothetical protein
MKRSAYIVTGGALLIFAVSWIWKASSLFGQTEHYIRDGFLVTLGAFLTLSILSFLYRDNPFYKFAEHLFVGVSAAFWMTLGFWSTIVGNLVPRLSESLAAFFKQPYIPGDLNFMFYIPVVFGLLLLMRLSPRAGWISRWSLAFIVGTTAGFNFVRYLRSDFINQVSASFVNLLVDWEGTGSFLSGLSLAMTSQFVAIVTSWIVFLGVMSGLVYFFFSKEHKGVFGRVSRVGIWVLMITFGASFGYTVMGRISLLVGRITFLFREWLGLIS